ncbi:predicted coding region TP0495 [Treponema pallidum subsp. pallidum str. Nichols]|uniref:Uncharacterized protein TP_0495 n=1 Tax=Treponema pallidum (strain Nichols) TaxID=243276 RepID=Y495_TREPA|nr:RecName: Full=Uncharacterized protein TP_0495 [Treponema pallidum subsp. pallidum str. Nichols]AAC65490.1 predicted coding region TP0495 [Treponema pallidum subsp. pallidum str. Nichols]
MLLMRLAVPFCRQNAVSSYLALSPLPKGGIFSVALAVSGTAESRCLVIN